MEQDNDPLAGLKRKSNSVKALFNSTRGLEVLKILEDEFDKSDLRGETNEATNYNLGARSVLVYLRQLYEVKFE